MGGSDTTSMLSKKSAPPSIFVVLQKPLLIALSVLLTIGAIGVFAAMVASWVRYDNLESDEVPAVNSFLAAYNVSQSILADTNGTASSTSNKTGTETIIGQAALVSEVATQYLSGWTKGLLSTVVSGVTLKSNSTLPRDASLTLQITPNPANPTVSATAPVASAVVPCPSRYKILTSSFNGGTCDVTCESLGAVESEHGWWNKSCVDDRMTSDSCSCHCFYRRYLTTACFVIENALNSTHPSAMQFRAGRPTCFAPYTLADGHVYTSRNVTSSISVEIRTADDPLFLSLEHVGSGMTLSKRPGWLRAAILLTVMWPVSMLIAGLCWAFALEKKEA